MSVGAIDAVDELALAALVNVVAIAVVPDAFESAFCL
jgi:hypothetical protein